MGKLDALNKLAVGSYGDEGETIDWSYWDTVLLANATPSHRMFTAPLGGATGRTLDETNMTTSGMIPQAQYFEVRAIKVFYASKEQRIISEFQDWITMITRTTLSIKLTNKSSTGEWPLDELFGLTYKWAGSAADVVYTLNPRFHGIFPLNNKIILAAMTPFEVNLVHHAASAATLDDDRFKVSLSGILTRAT